MLDMNEYIIIYYYIMYMYIYIYGNVEKPISINIFVGYENMKMLNLAP